MSTQQFQGKTVEEATKLALEELKVNLEEIKIEVISAGKSGILGLGGEPAIIQVATEKSKKVDTVKKRSVVKKEEKEVSQNLDDYSQMNYDMKRFPGKGYRLGTA